MGQQVRRQCARRSNDASFARMSAARPCCERARADARRCRVGCGRRPPNTRHRRDASIRYFVLQEGALRPRELLSPAAVRAPTIPISRELADAAGRRSGCLRPTAIGEVGPSKPLHSSGKHRQSADTDYAGARYFGILPRTRRMPWRTPRLRNERRVLRGSLERL
jgi:hypothetical protein